jgi:ribonuclease D
LCDEPDFQWIDSRAALEAFMRDLADRIAVDLEADSMYRYEERICLVQLSAQETHALIDPLALADLAPLRPLFESQEVEKVFHGADYDIRLLKRLAGIQPKRIFDTMVAAQLLGFRRVGLSDLLEGAFGIHLEKRYQKADWGRRPLPPEMIQYALRDTCYLLSLRDTLHRALAAKDRLTWAEEEFAALCEVEPAVRQPPDALRIRGARQLDDRGRAVLQALLVWREGEARRRNVPPYKIAGTSTLLELAELRPPTKDRMRQVHGVTRKVLRLWGDRLEGVIEEALHSRPIPRRRQTAARAPKRRPSAHRRFRLLKGVRDSRAAALDLDPGVLCPNAVLKLLSRVPAAEVESGLRTNLKKWQRDILGEDLRRALI